jgi:hypothetical protein
MARRPIMSPPDLDARADRAKQIAQSLFGRSLWRDGAELHCEIPADMAGAAASSFGQGGFSAVTSPGRQRGSRRAG